MIEPQVIIGVDESGRGALAGPLVVVAAAFRRGASPVTAEYRGLRGDKRLTAGDSKSFSNPIHREVLDQAIRASALALAVVERSAQEIDERLMSAVHPEATRLAIARVLEQLTTKGNGTSPADFLVMLDGEGQIPEGIPCPVRTVVDGDKHVWQIGAASIVAKVHCDARMLALHTRHPDWGFDQHKGYPTAAHRRLLAEHGPSPVHRITFRPVAEARGLPPGFES